MQGGKRGKDQNLILKKIGKLTYRYQEIRCSFTSISLLVAFY